MLVLVQYCWVPRQRCQQAQWSSVRPLCENALLLYLLALLLLLLACYVVQQVHGALPGA